MFRSRKQVGRALTLVGAVLALLPNLAASQALQYTIRESIPLPSGAVFRAAGHLDGDTALDVVLFQKAGTPRMWVVERDGASFVTRFTITDSSQMRQGLVGDLDGDGRPELVSGHLSDHYVRIWEATGDNTYVEKYSRYIGSKITTSGFGDSDNDGLMELLMGQEPSAHLHVIEGVDNDSYAYEGFLDGSGGNLTLAGVRDINGNGWPEVVFSDDSYSSSIERLHIFENGVEVYSDSGLNLQTHSLQDTDGNGLLEIVGEDVPSYTTRILENTDSGGGYNFVEVYNAPDYHFRVIDVEGDGRGEFWRAIDNGSGQRNVFALGRRSGATISDIYNSGSLLQFSAADVRHVWAIEDTNGDGQRELVVWQGEEIHFLEPNPNATPTADAGQDQSIHAGDEVFLNGGNSFDDNTPSSALLYSWSFSYLPAGSEAWLDGADTATPSFVADLPETYVVQLVVTDEGGLQSAPAEVVVSAENLPPTAHAGDDQLAVTGTTVYLDGSASSDPDYDSLEFAWSIHLSPAGSAATLVAADTAMPTLVPDVQGLYRIGLVVNDFIGPGWPDEVEITATTAEEFAEIKIEASSETIEELRPAEVTTKGNQRAHLNFLSQAMLAIQEGDLETARHKLGQALGRCDGCVLRGSPDGNGPGRDWITDCTAQTEVYPLLLDALEAIEPLEP